ncbi:hypothetical protein [Staphylococcus epidermidis]|uniref:hypothetical protein n=1 Tax=Staphylococcus epidermidis TaxID=1282 RepID=UPI001C3C8E1E|nr:hypothetical protein [Staphylococcus epidermidis]MBV5158306.1 hypothetical protein [Staphylococcus epidermidis]MCD8922009.1 hypothetical protein [Staphylococcus epidermidis]MCD9056249.1 hypothetical protein [Staphylococcus epidermidis]MEB5737018.1 hypothetical protein [Staphylococcus epidermidis]MEB7070130.1 hypothetical protein [Staphylococcus epidermidis]
MEYNELYQDFINGYKKETQNYNFLGEDLFKAFPLLKFEHYLKYIIFNVPEDIFSVKEYLVVVDNYDEIGSYINVSKDDFTHYHREIIESEKHNRFKLFLQKYYINLYERNIFKIIPIRFISGNNLSIDGKYEAESDYRKWKDENITSLDSYDHKKISPYSHLDYDGIIDNFDSEKYRDDFEYQMNQANECYKRKLFLPAAATLSVALETLLMAICDKENVKLKSKDATDTMMNYLGERLLQEGKINYRMHKRIDVTYSLRNSVSHSNPGEVSKADCQIILSCIKTLIDNHYSK